jgi:hypothetical protein
MRGLYFFVRRPAVGDLMLVQELKCFQRDLIDPSWKTGEPGAGGQIVKAARTILFREE